MKFSFVCLLAVAFLLGEARAQDLNRPQIERTLTSRLTWEILWNDLPAGLRSFPVGIAMLSVNVNSKLLSYCSRDLGACGQYRIEECIRTWQRLTSRKCCGNQSDGEALVAFVRQAVENQLPHADPRDYPAIGFGQPMKPPPSDSSQSWVMTTELGNRSEIIRVYRNLRSPEIEALRDWVRTDLMVSGYVSFTIPCFKPSDPVVYVLGNRIARDPIVASLFWNRQTNKWDVAEWIEDQQFVSGLKTTLDTVACVSAKFP